jgi:phosphatidylserine/phosphatidylglycerophosphate/cardiolipin synthase-like enzyme
MLPHRRSLWGFAPPPFPAISRKPAAYKRIVLLLAAILLLVGVSACGAGSPAPRANPAAAGGALPTTDSPAGNAADAWYAVYFTQPGSAQAQDYRGGPADALVEAIDRARLSVEVAAFDIDLWDVRDALLAAHRRGISVRIVTDRDSLETPEIAQLMRAGVPLVSDNQAGLMHHKFVIIDRREVWTGSMNLTVNSAYRNNDNLVRLRSADLAEDYLVEFNEMFVERRFGRSSQPNTPHPSLELQGTPLEVYFSPEDGVATHLVDLLRSARKSIRILAYSFTSDDLADVVLERARQGVGVTAVFEAQQVASNTGGEYQRLKQAGLDVRLDGNPRNMHHKVILIDDQIVIFGSYNFTANAEMKNDENLLVIHSPEIANQFLEEFKRIFDAAAP